MSDPFDQQPPPPPPLPPYAGTVALTPAAERTWGAAAHWSSLVASVVGLAFLGPLVVMLTKGTQSPYVRAQAVESLNFQLSMLIYVIVAALSLFVLVGLLLLPAVGVLWLVFTIIGSIKSVDGTLYRYPLTIRMIS